MSNLVPRSLGFVDKRSGPSCSDNPGLLRNFNSDMKASKRNSVLFFSYTIWWLDALKTIEKIIRENALEQKRKKPRLWFNLGFTLIGLQTTGPWVSDNSMGWFLKYIFLIIQLRSNGSGCLLAAAKKQVTPSPSLPESLCFNAIYQSKIETLSSSSSSSSSSVDWRAVDWKRFQLARSYFIYLIITLPFKVKM